MMAYTLRAQDGANIYVRKREPDGAPRAVLQIAHGLAEHIGRYAPFAAYLSERGFVVVGEDHRGHGKSANAHMGFFSQTDGWMRVVEDMRAVFERERAAYPGLPYFLLGHSMGSFLARTYITRYAEGLAGVVLSGTGQQSAPIVAMGKYLAKREAQKKGAQTPSTRLNGLCFGAYNKRFAPNRTPNDWLTRDEAVVDAYASDPLCGFVPTAGLFYDMLGGIRYNWREANLKRMPKDLPILLLSGEKDPVGGKRGVEKVFRRLKKLGMRDVQKKLYPLCRHEILNERNRQQVYEDVLGWLNAHCDKKGEQRQE